MMKTKEKTPRATVYVWELSDQYGDRMQGFRCSLDEKKLLKVMLDRLYLEEGGDYGKPRKIRNFHIELSEGWERESIAELLDQHGEQWGLAISR